MIFKRKQQTDEPFWSIKRQKAYKISRILWIAQIVIALLASTGIFYIIFRGINGN
jgi:flagellar basal body-associated protein FliL